MAAFATPDDLAVYLGREFTDAAGWAQAEMMLDLASDEIRRWARQTIDLVTGDQVTLTGTWTRELVLPERPVVSVGPVVVNDGPTLAAGVDYELDGSGVLYAGPLVTAGVVSGAYETTGSTGRGHWHWGGPDSVVRVTYTHGFNPIPPSVKAAVLGMAARARVNPTGLKQESVAGWSGTYDTGSVGLTASDMASLGWLRRRSL